MTSRAADAVEAALAVVDQREATVRAWAFLDPDLARAEARAVDARGGPLQGLVLGVKDIFDTADMPTECGSPIYAGRRPTSDAVAVALLRRTGATVLGKTVTTEFALFSPGPTTNPHRATHTPGGSSSGSAAAVSAGMCDLALGTQTAGSVIRPASFCGVFGFKPTFGMVSPAGVKQVAPSLDTVGWFARDVQTLERAHEALTGRLPAPPPAGPLRIAVVRTDLWERASADTHTAIANAAERAANGGAVVVDRDLPDAFVGIAEDQRVIQAYEAARSLGAEHTTHRDQLSAGILEVLDWGASLEPAKYARARARGAEARQQLDALFGDADVLLVPAAVGEAPEGLESPGDPIFSRPWAILGVPLVSVPGLSGSTGLPIGVQLVARHGDDDKLLAAARGLYACLASNT